MSHQSIYFVVFVILNFLCDLVIKNVNNIYPPAFCNPVLTLFFFWFFPGSPGSPRAGRPPRRGGGPPVRGQPHHVPLDRPALGHRLRRRHLQASRVRRHAQEAQRDGRGRVRRAGGALLLLVGHHQGHGENIQLNDEDKKKDEKNFVMSPISGGVLVFL